MCGILGQIDFKQELQSDEHMAAASARLRNRGPDDAGSWRDGAASLAHRRLAIIDVSAAGHQPMHSRDGRYVIVFNGEVYNYLELRRQLQTDPYEWSSRSDTEVVLAAYAQWGERCVDRFRGMYAFAIWDRWEKRLFAARDRMGVKPFYYHVTGQRMSFASRPRALLCLEPDLAKEIDLQALRLYLEIGYIPAPLSFHSGIRKLPPAHYLVFDRAGLRIQRYWDFRAIGVRRDWRSRREGDLLEELDEIVNRCVRLRMISDVPLGAFLSGGIDSSLVVGVMARHAAQPVKTFTIGFEEAEFDESVHAKRVASELGAEHRTEQLRVDGLLALLPAFLEEFDEPFFDSSAFPTMAVSRLARQHVTVSLSGDGGDELFGGYHYYRIAHRLQPFFRMPAALRRCMGAAVRALPKHELKLLGASLSQANPARAFGFARSIAKDFDSVLDPDVLAVTAGISEVFDGVASGFARDLTDAERGMRIDAALTLPDDYLQKVDVASMAFSLESREPLLDHELVEWAMQLPLDWKLRGSNGKYLLRRLAYRYVPANMLDRPKKGFAVPIDQWLRGPLKAWAQERFNDRTLLGRLPINQDAVRDLNRLHLNRTRNVHPLLWAVLMLLGYVEHHLS